jgi:hypothetical protein
VPALSVRIAQPCRPPVCELLVAGDSCLVFQLRPPSLDFANSTGSGAPLPTPRKPTLQT